MDIRYNNPAGTQSTGGKHLREVAAVAVAQAVQPEGQLRPEAIVPEPARVPRSAVAWGAQAEEGGASPLLAGLAGGSPWVGVGLARACACACGGVATASGTFS